MGSNASTTRKSTAGTRASTAGYRKAVRKENELEEEFSDLILHEVSKTRVAAEQQGAISSPQVLQGVSSADVSMGSVLVPVLDDSDSRLAQPFPIETAEESDIPAFKLETATESHLKRPSFPKSNFLSELIEDEFNELNDGLLETENPQLARNIIPNDDDTEFDRDIEEDHKEGPQASKRDLDMRSRSHPPSQCRNVGDKHLKSKSLMIEELDVKRKKVAATTPVHTPLNDAMDIDKKNSFHRPGVFTQPAVNPELRYQNSTQSDTCSNPINSQITQGSQVNQSGDQGNIPVEIKWVNVLKENIQKISIIGLFSDWRDVLRLQELEQHPGELVKTVHLPLGVHKLLYIINNEYRVLDMLPTATDKEGIFFNWFEVLDEAHLFNHSQNQPIHVGASTEYDANIISLGTNPTVQSAGKYDVDRINRKSTSFLTQISKQEEQPEFEHVEFGDSEMPPASPEEKPLQQFQNVLNNYPQAIPQTVGPLTPPIQPNYVSSAHGLASNMGTPKYILYQDGSFLSQHETEKPVYSSEIPEMFLNYDYFKSKAPDYQLPEPPQLPAQLNNVLLYLSRSRKPLGRRIFSICRPGRSCL